MLRLLGLVLLVLTLTGCSGLRMRLGLGTAAIELDKYTLRQGPITLDGVQNNASGLTFNPDTKTLFLVLNGPTEIFELTLDGTVRRRIVLSGFSDTEGIAYIEGDTYAVVEERDCAVRLFKVSEATNVLRSTAATVDVMANPTKSNTGLEGITLDRHRNRLLVVKEKVPRRICEVPLPTTGGGRDIVDPWDAEKDSLDMSDLAGVHYHAGTRHLLILSHESKCIVECTTDGREIGRLSLRRGSAGLSQHIPQPEGITMDDRGTLYICSEPNLLYIFDKHE